MKQLEIGKVLIQLYGASSSAVSIEGGCTPDYMEKIFGQKWKKGYEFGRKSPHPDEAAFKALMHMTFWMQFQKPSPSAKRLDQVINKLPALKSALKEERLYPTDADTPLGPFDPKDEDIGLFWFLVGVVVGLIAREIIEAIEAEFVPNDGDGDEGPT